MNVRALVLAWLAVSTAALSGQAPTQGKSTVIQRIIVKVNGEIFTQTDLEARQVDELRDQNRQVRSPEDLQNDAVLSKLLAEITPDILLDVVDELLLVQRGREIGASFTDASFNQAIENIKKINNFTDETFKTALAANGMTLNELRQNLERQYLIQSVQRNEIMRGMSVTDQEARQYYKANPDQFKKPATITLREIFVEVPTTGQGGQASFSAAADDEARARVEAARARALKGEDFAKLVAEVSEAGSKANGGLVGPVLISDMAEGLVRVLGPLKVGDVTEPIRTARGYTLFKLESRIEEGVQPFERVKDEVTQRILEGRLDEETTKHLEKLRAQALIEWKDEGYRLMYEKAQKNRIK